MQVMSLTEAETRRNLIDTNLRLAGWDLRDPSQVIPELDIHLAQAVMERPATPYVRHQFADYGLVLHGAPRGVIEAKRTSVDAALGQEQALQYAQQLQQRQGGLIPLIFYTNGYDHYFWESDFYPPVKVYGFPTRDDLEWLEQRRATRKPLSVELINAGITGRDYQIAAIRSVLEGLERKRRCFLLVMATGTGKTRTAVSLLDVLLRAKWAKRVLFLVDRIPLQEQALGAFQDFLPSAPCWPQIEGHSIEREFVRNRRVYVTTYPTMLHLIQNGTTSADWISPYFFDVVIADESHRSIYNTYTQVLQYFHAIKLGLTATPTDYLDHDTFQLFECPANDPTFAYTYAEATAHVPPYLCDFEVLKVRSKFQLEGIHGAQLPPAVQRRLVATGQDIENLNFEGTDLERKVTNSGTNALIVREFMEECIKDGSGTLPGKSIIFAISKGHARRLQDLFDGMYPQHAGRLARVLVSEDPRVYGQGGLLDPDFQAMRFETNVIELGTALLSDNQDAVDGLRECLVEQVSELALSVNVVARERELIAAVQQAHWWSAPTEDKLRQLVDRLAPLMKYRQKRPDALVKLDIPDLLAIKETIEFGPDHERLTSSVYREKVEAFVRSLVANNPVLQKLQAGGTVTDVEIGELARLLESQALHVTEDLLRKVYDHRTARFIQFIRHILGLERLESRTEAVNRAFDEFIAQHTTFTSLQIRFLQTLRTFVLQTGRVEKRALIDAPFTRIHPQGIRGVFAPGEIEEILQFVEGLAA
jgi:type I site-specific restriction endonuclease